MIPPDYPSPHPPQAGKHPFLLWPGGGLKLLDNVFREIQGGRAQGMGKGQGHDKGMAAMGIAAGAVQDFDGIRFFPAGINCG